MAYRYERVQVVTIDGRRMEQTISLEDKGNGKSVMEVMDGSMDRPTRLEMDSDCDYARQLRAWVKGENA